MAEELRSRIFRDRRYLDPLYPPDLLLYRDKQLGELDIILSPARNGERPLGCNLFGYPGTGKTSVANLQVRSVAEATRNYITPFRSILVRCNSIKSLTGVYEAMLVAHGEEVRHSGMNITALEYKVRRKLEGERGVFLVVLDEADKMKGELDVVIYSLLEMNTELKCAQVAVMIISNKSGIPKELEERTLSRFLPRDVYFPPYSTEELVGILSSRAKAALCPGVLEEDAKVLAAAHSSKQKGDARKAIDVLRTAGIIAEAKGKTRITMDDVSQAAGRVEQDDVKKMVQDLPDQPKLVLTALVRDGRARNATGWPSTGDIYELYRAEAQRAGESVNTLRQLGNYLKDLESVGLLALEVRHYGQSGNTTKAILAVPLSDLAEFLGLTGA